MNNEVLLEQKLIIVTNLQLNQDVVLHVREI